MVADQGQPRWNGCRMCADNGRDLSSRFQQKSAEPQIPPRHAGTGRLRSVEKHFQEEASTQRSLRSPGFPVEVGCAGEQYAPFLKERRTRGLVQRSEAGNP